MSHSIRVTSSPLSSSTFLSILTPTVVWYLSENMLCTKRATRLVFPTPNDPSRQIFFFSILGSQSITRVRVWQLDGAYSGIHVRSDVYAACLAGQIVWFPEVL